MLDIFQLSQCLEILENNFQCFGGCTPNVRDVMKTWCSYFSSSYYVAYKGNKNAHLHCQQTLVTAGLWKQK